MEKDKKMQALSNLGYNITKENNTKIVKKVIPNRQFGTSYCNVPFFYKHITRLFFH